MTLVQLANYFNILVQQHPDIKFFHHGLPQGVNIGIDNNSNPDNLTGVLYPALYLLPPVLSLTDLQQPTPRVYRCEVLLLDLLYFHNDGTQSTETRPQVWSRLTETLHGFLYELLQVGTAQLFGSDFFELSNVQYQPLDSLTVDGSTGVRATFDLTTFSPLCAAPFFDPQAVAPPYSFPPSESSDYEDYRNP